MLLPVDVRGPSRRWAMECSSLRESYGLVSQGMLLDPDLRILSLSADDIIAKAPRSLPRSASTRAKVPRGSERAQSVS